MFRSDDDVSANAGASSAGDDAGELACRRSLRGSRARRSAAALRRRRALRSRGSAFMVTAGVLLLSAAAVANTSTGGATAGAGLSATTISAAQRALGIEADGVVGPATRRATRRFQHAHGLNADGRLGPRTLKALGVDADGREVSSAALDPRLAQIAQCESGGDPRAVSGNGRYFGKYQFSLTTWRAVGGSGNPAKASEAEQDRRAARLLRLQGTKPWPNCA